MESFHILGRRESNAGREDHHHVPPLVKQKRAASAAAHLDRQSRLSRGKLSLISGFVESQMLWVQVVECNVCFMEDGGPLEGSR